MLGKGMNAPRTGKEKINIEPTQGRFEMMVDTTNTARTMGSWSLEVLATPAMVAMMEHAACLALEGALPEELTTVGVDMQVSHVSASPVGMKVWAEAELMETDGRQYTFEIEAFDQAGPIGKAVHKRASVKKERFMQKTQGKLQK